MFFEFSHQVSKQADKFIFFILVKSAYSKYFKHAH